MKFPTNADTGEYLDVASSVSWARQNGVTGKPFPPRNLQAQGGSRKLLVTWSAPEDTTGIIGYKVYKDTENQLLDTITDPNVRQYSVPANSGASPVTTNVFVSSFTKRDESQKVQVQGKASTEAGAPSDPSPPAGSAATGDTGPDIGFDGSDAGFTRGG